MAANTYGSMLFFEENSSDSALLKSVQESVLSTYSHYENDEIRPDLFT